MKNAPSADGAFFSLPKKPKGFSAKGMRFALRLGCPPKADNSTLATRKVFFATYTPPQKTSKNYSRRARRELCEAFLQAEKMRRLRTAHFLYQNHFFFLKIKMLAITMITLMPMTVA